MKSLQVRRLIFSISLCAGILWNVLCLTHVFPLEKWVVSAGIVGLGSLFIISLYLFPKSRRIVEKSKYIKEMSKQEKLSALSTILIAIGWLLTTINCLFFQL